MAWQKHLLHHSNDCGGYVRLCKSMRVFAMSCSVVEYNIWCLVRIISSFLQKKTRKKKNVNFSVS